VRLIRLGVADKESCPMGQGGIGGSKVVFPQNYTPVSLKLQVFGIVYLLLELHDSNGYPKVISKLR
jgi:hypothetical protein